MATHDNTDTPTGFTGCEKLSIEPSLSAVPDTSFADTPAGLTAEVKVPQETLEEPEGLVAATLKNTSVTLPEGLVINPGQAAGLQACQEAEANLHGEGPQSCPNASKVGTVKIQTPLLEEELEPELKGDVYVLQSNPPELKLLVAASADGIYLKLVGDVHLNEATGQLTTTFTETPELPFTDFKLSFSRWRAGRVGDPDTVRVLHARSRISRRGRARSARKCSGSNSFSIGAGPLGAPCPSGPLPFHPVVDRGRDDRPGGCVIRASRCCCSVVMISSASKNCSSRRRGPGGDDLQRHALPRTAGLQRRTCPAASQIGHTTSRPVRARTR